MPNEISTVQSLRAVDAWIDVINANINGGVRTAFKSSRLKFGGTNTNVIRPGGTTSLPLQIPEPGLVTTNTVIDFTQGAITASTENTHLAIQGEGFFMVMSNVTATGTAGFPINKVLLTRDGEFHTNQDGLLVNTFGYYLCTFFPIPVPPIGFPSVVRAVYNDIDLPVPSGAAAATATRLSDFLKVVVPIGALAAGGAAFGFTQSATLTVQGKQNLKFSQFGSTYFDFGFDIVNERTDPSIVTALGTASDATILSKSLEASNASMTQSVPELSLAQKLFSALTKILQTSQTNTDAVLNLVR